MVNNIIMKIVYHYQNNLQLGRGIWSLYMGLESFDFWLLIFCSLCKSLETLMEFLFWPLCWAVCLRSMRCLLCLLSPLDGSQRRLRQTNCRIIAYSGNLVFLHVCNSLLYCKCCTPTVVEQLLPTRAIAQISTRFVLQMFEQPKTLNVGVANRLQATWSGGVGAQRLARGYIHLWWTMSFSTSWGGLGHQLAPRSGSWAWADVTYFACKQQDVMWRSLQSWGRPPGLLWKSQSRPGAATSTSECFLSLSTGLGVPLAHDLSSTQPPSFPSPPPPPPPPTAGS